MSMLMDPAGAPFYLWQSRSSDAGDFVMFEDHAIGRGERASRDLTSARDFYVGGILPMTAEWGELTSHWSIYVLVPDVDGCMARAAELGG